MIVRARYKNAEETDPALFCCEALRASASLLAGAIFKVDAEIIKANKMQCGYCGQIHEYRSLLVVEGPEGTVGGWLHIGCIDIEEGTC
jgi:hypothetical protein